MKKYFYPISSTSLAAIFGQACILPASLYKNRLPDIQNKFEQYILLTENFGCQEVDCCLQIVLTIEEEKSLVNINGGFYLFESALPITRIRKIYFSDSRQAFRTIPNITLSTAFIPQYLVDDKNNIFDNVNISITHLPEDIVSSMDNIKTCYEKYNRTLGAMALMNTAREEGCNFSKHYIDLLSKFNTYIRSQKSKISEIDTKFNKVFERHPAFLDKIVNFEILENEASESNQIIRKDNITKVINPSNLDKSTYICYVLYDYGVGDESHRHKIDELILNNFTGLKQGYEESCALYYGYNRGYACFNSHYKKDDKTVIVKFQLNSLLDYYTIESIYRYCFSNEVSSKFDLFDSWVKIKPLKKAKRGEYLIIDQLVRDKKKAILFSDDWWNDCLSFLPKDKLSFLGLDFSSIIIQMILKPFASRIKEEISSDYKENLQAIKDKYELDIQHLKKELDNYKEQLSTIKNKGEVDCNVDEFANQIIELCKMTLPQLKDLAMQYDCKVKGHCKKETLIHSILHAQNHKCNKLFN